MTSRAESGRGLGGPIDISATLGIAARLDTSTLGSRPTIQQPFHS